MYIYNRSGYPNLVARPTQVCMVAIRCGIFHRFSILPRSNPHGVCIVRTDCSRRFLGHQLPFLPATRPDITNKRLLVLQSFYTLLSACQVKKYKEKLLPFWQAGRPICHFGRQTDSFTNKHSALYLFNLISKETISRFVLCGSHIFIIPHPL